MASLGPASIVALFSICYLIYTISFTYISGVARSMQREFQISQCGLGWLYVAAAFAYVITITITSYFGDRGRKNRWLGGGFLIVAVGCIALVFSSFVAPNPVVDDPKEEKELWKTAFEPLSLENIKSSRRLVNTYWGRRLPDFVRTSLNATEVFVTEPKDDKSALQKRSINLVELPELSRTIERIRRSIYLENEFDESSDFHLLAKRQLPEYVFPDDLKDRLVKGVEGAVFDYTFWGGTYDTFARKLYNLTNDPEIFERMMKAARLPFGYCRNSSSIIRGRLQEQYCNQRPAISAIVGLIIAFIGFILIGVGSTTIWTVGVSLLDDQINKRSLPLCLGLVFGVQAIAFIAGFVLGLLFEFKFYSTFTPPRDIVAIDPRWVGAWWLGFVIIAILLAIPASLMAFMSLRKRNGDGGTKNSRTPEQESDRHLVRAHVGGESDGKWKGISSSIFEVCRPPIFVALLLALTFDALALKGYFDVLPRFYENNYSPSMFKSAFTIWLYSIGIILGGLLLRFTRLDGRKAAVFLISLTFISAVFSLAFSHPSFSCQNVVRRVQEAGLKNTTNGRPNWPSCPGCICDHAEFYPVCANDTRSTPFYSPCHAGCTNFTYEIVKANVEFYFDYCFCAAAVRMRVSRDSCVDDCSNPSTIYFILSSLAALLSGTVLVPAILFIIRTSSYHLRSLALGVVGLAVCVFGILPSGLLYRYTADSTCFIWRSPCSSLISQRLACEIFDGPLLRERLHVLLGVLRLVAVLFYGLVWYHAKDVQLFSNNRSTNYETELSERQQLTEEEKKVNV